MKKSILLLAAAGFLLSAQAQNPNQTTQPSPSTQPNQRSQTNQPQDRSQGVIQDRDVPNTVITSFNSAYPNVSGVKWRMDGGNYKAMYKTSDNKEMIIVYDNSGNLIKTKAEIETSQLPSKAMEYVSANYNNENVKEAYRVTEANGTITYKAEVRQMHLIFDTNGNFIRSEKKDGNKSNKTL